MAVDPRMMLSWVRRLVALDGSVFDEVRINPSATIPAVILAALAIFLSGIGGWLWWSIPRPTRAGARIFIDSAVIGSLIATALWGVIWVGLVYFFLTQFFRERVFLEQLFRVMGLATAPLSLTLLMVLPEVSFAMGIGALVLTFTLTTMAIQTVTAAEPLQVLMANLAGFTVWAGFLSIFVSTNHIYAPGIFVYVFPAHVADDLYGLGSHLQSVIQ